MKEQELKAKTVYITLKFSGLSIILKTVLDKFQGRDGKLKNASSVGRGSPSTNKTLQHKKECKTVRQ